MRVLLEFLNARGDTRLHERELEFDGFVPIPAAGDEVVISDVPADRVTAVVQRRTFVYVVANDPAAPDVKVTFICEERRS